MENNRRELRPERPEAAIWMLDMNENLRKLGYTDQQVAALSTALEKSGATFFAPCAATAKDAYAALRLSADEVAAIRAPNAAQ
ncbi:hypothetical protein [Paraburkholderia strydomiana]